MLHWNPDLPLSGYRIAYAKTAFENAGQGRGGAGGRGGATTPPTADQQQVAADTKKSCADVLATYEKLGAKLEGVDVPPEIAQITGAIGFILETESGASFDDMTRSGDINLLENPNGSKSSWHGHVPSGAIRAGG